MANTIDTTGRHGFQADLEALINRHSMENGSNTPDYILALYMRACLEAFDRAVETRDNWYGVKLAPGRSRVHDEIDAAHARGYREGHEAALKTPPERGDGRA